MEMAQLQGQGTSQAHGITVTLGTEQDLVPAQDPDQIVNLVYLSTSSLHVLIFYRTSDKNVLHTISVSNEIWGNYTEKWNAGWN